jgi:hypothetical protein
MCFYYPIFFFRNYLRMELFWVFIHRLRLEEDDSATACTMHAGDLIFYANKI